MLENPNVTANIVPFQDASCFDLNWMFGAQIGKDTTSNFAFSFAGLAVRTLDNRWLVPKLDNNGNPKVTDVTCLTIGIDPCVYRIPVVYDSVTPGNLLIRSDAPFSVVFVTEKLDGHRIKGIDPRTDEVVEIIVPSQELDVPSFLVRAFSLFDGLDGGIFGGGKGGDVGGTNLSAMLPLLLLSGGLGGTNGGLNLNGNNNLLMALALSKGGSFGNGNPLMFLLLAGAGSGSGVQSNSLLQALLLSSMFSGGGGFFGGNKSQGGEQGKESAEHAKRAAEEAKKFAEEAKKSAEAAKKSAERGGPQQG
jgi:hypothetical protein